MKRGNLYDRIPGILQDELFETLATGEGKLKIERIVSRQHSSPPNFWYDPSATEWVMILKGSALLRFADNDETISMKAGDWLQIDACQKHRVDATSESEDTVWLAIHWE